MPGLGKYTKFAPVANDKNNLLNKLFRGDSKVPNPVVDLVGKEVELRQQVVDRAKQFLAPEHQEGDTALFPVGVNLDFSGDPNGVTPPDTTEGKDVKWETAGDPANSFTPDLRSPGPGFTSAPSAENLQTNPEITVKDIKGDGYIPGAPGTGTKSPAKTGPAVHKAITLGETSTLGSSGTDKVGA